MGENKYAARALRKFDLKEGDVVTHGGIYYETTKNGERRVMSKRTYRVTHISNWIFMVEDWFGHKTSFTKLQYQLGEVNRA